MVNIETAGDMREILEITEGSISDPDWEAIRPKGPTAFDGDDLKACLERYRGIKPQTDKGKGDVERTLGDALQGRPFIDLVLWSHTAKWREDLGIERQLKINEIREVLLKMGLATDMAGIPLAYPKQVQSMFDDELFELFIWDIDYLYVPWGSYLLLHTMLISRREHWHPAMALTALLCDFQPTFLNGIEVIKYRDSVELYINGVASPNHVKKAYSQVRRLILKDIWPGERGRRQSTEKALRLWDECKNLSVEDRFRELTKHGVKYASVNSMKVAISQAKKRANRIL